MRVLSRVLGWEPTDVLALCAPPMGITTPEECVASISFATSRKPISELPYLSVSVVQTFALRPSIDFLFSSAPASILITPSANPRRRPVAHGGFRSARWDTDRSSIGSLKYPSEALQYRNIVRAIACRLSCVMRCFWAQTKRGSATTVPECPRLAATRAPHNELG